MKYLEELGVSPTPWDSHRQFVMSADDGSVVAASSYRDARLIAAAPELYKCLCEAINQTCINCKNKKCNYCKVVNKWISALAKASIEDDMNDSEVDR